MITLTFIKSSKPKLGVKTKRGILEVQRVVEKMKQSHHDVSTYPLTVQELVAAESAEHALKDILDFSESLDESFFLDESEIQYGPSVVNPQKIICVGLNYKPHVEESRMELPDYPILFSKFNNALIGNESEVSIPTHSTQVDYEAELAIVIGKEAKDVKKEDALSYVYGYTIANDLSARDLQFLTSQWLLGKSCDGFCPLGPYLVTKDEIANPNELGIKTYVNEDIRQNSNTSKMIFNCEKLISFISSHMTLFPGDVILSGTPEGVILGYEKSERVWLKNGDIISIEIDGLGKLTNIIKDQNEIW
ncbi:fumarylacetoacetate hydrolase family protein [Bacillus sp. 1P02SD]|uniref:fumarylacetoacetate hydrolase family protein n=1 Tax=Bacillus sp. 1P02SD TaxID=3132264 RepID=UPI0039A1DEAB